MYYHCLMAHLVGEYVNVPLPEYLLQMIHSLLDPNFFSVLH